MRMAKTAATAVIPTTLPIIAPTRDEPAVAVTKGEMAAVVVVGPSELLSQKVGAVFPLNLPSSKKICTGVFVHDGM